jgi:hypothetical protein
MTQIDLAETYLHMNLANAASPLLEKSIAMLERNSVGSWAIERAYSLLESSNRNPTD